MVEQVEDNNKEELNKIKDTLISNFEYFSNTYKPQTEFQKATFVHLKNAVCKVKGIFILLTSDLVTESSILARSLMNLQWNFLFLINAHQTNDKKWQFEDEPKEDSVESTRAGKYFDWFGVEKYIQMEQKGQTDPRMIKFMNTFKKKYGYKSDKEIPKYWYQEKNISTIRDIAKTIGAEKQYDVDYSFLSGIEHSDYTAFLMSDHKAEKYEYYLYLKCLNQLWLFLDIIFLIAKKEPDEKLNSAVSKLESLTNKIAIP